MQTTMLKLNLGSKTYHIEGFVSVDIRDDVGAEVICDVSDLPFDDGSVDEIYAGHLVEHFDCLEFPGVLDEWWRVLVDGGRLVVSFPDFLKGVDKFREGSVDLEGLNTIIFANASREGQTHHQLVSAGSMCGELMSAGFDNVHELDNYEHLVTPQSCGWQSVVEGFKGGVWTTGGDGLYLEERWVKEEVV